MSDQYALAAARVSVAQMADAAGFDAMQKSSVAILSELLVRYMEEVGVGSHAYTELAGRTEPNAMDVLLALNDLGVSVAELQDFKQSQKNMPFPVAIVPFPVAKRTKPTPTFAEQGETPPSHIPAFLPAFPDRHTYSQTTALAMPDPDPVTRHLASMAGQQEAEHSLVKLHARAAPQDPVLASALPVAAAEVEEEGPKGAQGLAPPDPWDAPLQPDDGGPPAPPFPTRERDDDGGSASPVDVDMEQAEAEAEAGQSHVQAAPLDAEAGAELAAALAPVFQPWDWQAQLTGLVALSRSTAPEADAFAAAAPDAALATKAGRAAKRSARALDSGYAPSDPARQRVEDIIAVSGAGEAGAGAAAASAADVMYGADEDEAEQL